MNASHGRRAALWHGDRLRRLLEVWRAEAAAAEQQLAEIERTYTRLTPFEQSQVPEEMRCYLLARSARLQEIVALDRRHIEVLRATLAGEPSGDTEIPPLIASLLE